MSKLQKLVSLLLCACMLLSAAALAEDAPAAEPTADTGAVAAITAAELASDTVLATVNGDPIIWGDLASAYNSLVGSYGSYYDLTLQENIELFRAVALENIITERLLMQKAKELGLDQLSEEEAATAESTADSDWNTAIENYLSYYHSELTDESTEEEKAAAKEEAVKYYNDSGYTPESLRESYRRYAIFDKVEAMMTQDVAVTDEEVEKVYQDLVAADKELYQNDIAAYVEYKNYVDQMAMYAMMYGSASDMDYPWYKPAGFRAVKHILLEVDADLMSTYTDLQARYEEQLSGEASEAQSGEGEVDTAASAAPDAEPTAEPTATPEPVTEEQVNAAKAAILESLADKIDEINQKIADGADFDELIATYGVKADGTATDPGMTSEPYKTSGYEVAAASSNYVPAFVEAAFSVDSIGDVSAPYLSNLGVHIVKYIGDVAEGPIAMTDAQREAKRTSLLESKKSELYTKTLEQWMTEADIAYTGATPSIAEIEAKQAEAEAAAGEPSDSVSEEEAENMVENGAENSAEPTAAPAE